MVGVGVREGQSTTQAIMHLCLSLCFCYEMPAEHKNANGQHIHTLKGSPASLQLMDSIFTPSRAHVQV